MVAHDDLLGPATTSWNDFVGTAAADESSSDLRPSLYELVGLDPAAWIILGLDLTAVGPASGLVVYALDRAAHGVTSQAELVELGQRSGELPVTAFELKGSGGDRLGTSVFERLAVRLVARPFHDQRLTVKARRRGPATLWT